MNYVGAMVLDWEQVVIDARDPQALGRWWAEALGWLVTTDSDEEFEIRPTTDSTPRHSLHTCRESQDGEEPGASRLPAP